MATPTLISVVNVAFPGGSVTIPPGADAYVAAGTYYDGASQAITGLTGSRITTQTLRAVASTDYMGAYLAWGKVNSTGSDTLSLTKAGFFSEGPTCQIAFLAVDDPDDFVRDDECVANIGGAISRTLDSATSDLLLAWIGSDGGGTVSGAITGWTAQGTEQTTNADKSRVFRANTPGATSTSITGPANSYPTLCAISLKEGGGLSPVSVDLSVTDAADTISGAAGLTVGASLTRTDAADTLSAASTMPITVALSVTDAGDTLSSSVALPVAVGLDLADAADTLAATAVVGSAPVEVTFEQTDALDGLSSAAAVLVGADLATTDAPDTLGASAALTVGVALALTDAADTVGAASTMPVTAAASLTDALDTASAAAGVAVVASLASTDVADALSATAQVQQAGVVGVTFDQTDALDTLQSQASVEQGQAGSAHGFVLTDHDSALWWKRKPRAIAPAVAQQRLARVVRALDKVAARSVEQGEPVKPRQVRAQIAPLLADMPGFDWRPLLAQIVQVRQAQEAGRLAALEVERIRAIAQDDEDVLLLLMSI